MTLVHCYVIATPWQGQEFESLLNNKVGRMLAFEWLLGCRPGSCMFGRGYGSYRSCIRLKKSQLARGRALWPNSTRRINIIAHGRS
jgi:hypothetical protein